MEHSANCGAQLRIIAAILEAPVIERNLTHLRLQTRSLLRAPTLTDFQQAALLTARHPGFGQGLHLAWEDLGQAPLGARVDPMSMRLLRSGGGAAAAQLAIGVEVAQALAAGELRKRHGAELLGARKRTHAARVAALTLHDARETHPRNELHDLSEQSLASIHVHSPGCQARESTRFLTRKIQVGTK